MSSIRAVTGPIVLAALFATTPQLAVGLDRGDESSVEITCHACRPGTEIKSDQLMEFLAENVNVRFVIAPADIGEVPRNDEFILRLQLISREEGVVGKWESEAVKVEAGKRYPASTWGIPTMRDFLIGPANQYFTIGRMIYNWGNYTTGAGFPEAECGEATYALILDVLGATDDERTVRDKAITGGGTGDVLFCLNVEG